MKVINKKQCFIFDNLFQFHSLQSMGRYKYLIRSDHTCKQLSL